MVAFLLAIVPTTHSSCVALSLLERVYPILFPGHLDGTRSFAASPLQGTTSIWFNIDIFSSTLSNQKSEVVSYDYDVTIILSAIVRVSFYHYQTALSFSSQRDT